MTTEKLVQLLEIAKKNVQWLINNGEGSIDMKGIAYWAGQVEHLREEIKKQL